MKVLAIDPGNIESGWVVWDCYAKRIIDKGKTPNDELMEHMQGGMAASCDHVVIEMVACYGMPVGASVFETCVWVGRFAQACKGLGVDQVHTLYRKDVKLEICGQTRAKDANIRQAIIDRFPATGGGKTPQVGTKNKPGPLFGVKADIWAALALALTFSAKRQRGELL